MHTKVKVVLFLIGGPGVTETCLNQLKKLVLRGFIYQFF